MSKKAFLFLFLISFSCTSSNIIRSKKKSIEKLEMTVIYANVSSPVAITEEQIVGDLGNIGYRDTIENLEYLAQLQNEIKQLEPVELKRLSATAFLFSSRIFYKNKKEGVYFSFSGYQGNYYMYVDKKPYKWKQELANLLYQKFPARVMETVPNEIL